jgi:hypothetical protein
MLFPLVREMLHFYSQRHSSMTLSLTFISSKYEGRNCSFPMDSIDDALIHSYSESSVYPLLSLIHAHKHSTISSLVLLSTVHPLA